jgi:hypothetical protein
MDPFCYDITSLSFIFLRDVKKASKKPLEDRRRDQQKTVSLSIAEKKFFDSSMTKHFAFSFL